MDIFGLKKSYSKKPKFTKKGVSHTKDGHVRRKPSKWDGEKSNFTGEGGEWRGLTRKTVANPDKVHTQDNKRQVFQKDFGRKIGVDKNGNAVTKVRVVLEPNGDLVTSFPQGGFQ